MSVLGRESVYVIEILVLEDSLHTSGLPDNCKGDNKSLNESEDCKERRKKGAYRL